MPSLSCVFGFALFSMRTDMQLTKPPYAAHCRGVRLQMITTVINSNVWQCSMQAGYQYDRTDLPMRGKWTESTARFYSPSYTDTIQGKRNRYLSFSKFCQHIKRFFPQRSRVLTGPSVYEAAIVCWT